MKQPALSLEEERAMESVLQGWVLQAIAQSKKEYGQWVFHGGTALKKAFHSTRYSEDLDFMIEPSLDTQVLMNKVADHIQVLMNKVADHIQVLASLTYGHDSSVRLKARTSDKNPQMYHVVLSVPSLTMSNVKVKVEFSPTQHLAAYATASLMTPPDMAQVRNKVAHAKSVRLEVGDLQQIFLDKWVALTMRPEIKHRDVWDLSWLLEKKEIANLETPWIWSNMQRMASTFYPGNDATHTWLFNTKNRLALMQTNEYRDAFMQDMQRWLDNDTAIDNVAAYQERINRVVATLEGGRI